LSRASKLQLDYVLSCRLRPQVDRSGDGDFERGDDGRMVIAEEKDGGRGGKRALKRGRPQGDSDDDDSEGDDNSLGALTQVLDASFHPPP